MSKELITSPIPTEVDTTRITPLGEEITRRCNELAVIDSPEKANEAGEVIKLAAKYKAQVEADLGPLKAQTYAAWKKVCDLINKHTAFTDAAGKLRDRTAAYLTAEKEKAQAEQRRLEAEARAKAEAAAQAERDRLVQQAAEMEAQGMNRAAERTLAEAERVEAAPIQVQSTPKVEAPKVSGLTTRDNWSAKLIDITKVPAEYLMFDQKAADAFARATKGTKQVPGIEFVNTPSTINLGR